VTRSIIFLTIFFCFAVIGQAQEIITAATTTETLPDVYLAKDDGKGDPGEPASEFITSDTPIHCVVRLENDQTVTVKMYLVAVSVKGLRAGSRVVAASYTTKPGQSEVYFNGRPDPAWLVGNYRADIFIDGKPFRSVDFVVNSKKTTQTATPAANPTPPTTVRPVVRRNS
jgi:hypothetical protein